MKTHNILWWNLENLFEVDKFPGRPAWLQKTLAKELKGWNENVLTKKNSQLAAVIQRVNPDILGCCEIENESVLNRLVTAWNLWAEIIKYSTRTQKTSGV